MADWQKLADDFIREFDSQVFLKKDGRKEDGHTHLANSQYVVSLHRDSKGQILHLHINANRPLFRRKNGSSSLQTKKEREIMALRAY